MSTSIKWYRKLNWYKVVIFAIFVPVILGAVMISAQHTYDILIALTDTGKYYAIGAAAVIDLAMILLGTMSAYNAKLREDITQLNWATWFLIVVSTGVNFLHGYMATGLTGGLVAMIYPVVGALAYHFIIWMTTSESRRLAKRTLVEKAYVPSSVDKATKKRLEKLRADYHVALEEDKLVKLHATTIGTWRQTDDYKPTNDSTTLQAEATLGDNTTNSRLQLTTNATSEMLQGDNTTTYDYNLATTTTDVAIEDSTNTTTLQSSDYKPTNDGDNVVTTEATILQDVANIVDSVETDVEVPTYLDATMRTAEMCRLLVANGISDNTTAYKIINKLVGDEVLKKTVQDSMRRERAKVTTTNN